MCAVVTVVLQGKGPDKTLEVSEAREFIVVNNVCSCCGGTFQSFFERNGEALHDDGPRPTYQFTCDLLVHDAENNGRSEQ